MKRTAANIVREYGPFPDVSAVHGVTYDGTNVWIATGDTLKAVDPDSGKTVRKLDVPAQAGTAFDGQHLFQIAEDRIQKIDPESGRVLATIPTPDGGASGMAILSGATAGYLVGFIVAAYVIGLLAERGLERSVRTSIIPFLIGTLIIYLFGVTWLSIVLGSLGKGIEFGLLPFLLGDAIKLAAATLLLPGAWQLYNK